MKHILILCLGLFSVIWQRGTALQIQQTGSISARKNNLPSVLPGNRADLVAAKLKLDAFIKFTEHKLPDTPQEWEIYRNMLKSEIIKRAGVVINHELPLNIRETGKTEMNGYSIRNIAFQTFKGIYATANLYIPHGKGPFPAVIHMLGHWTKGKIDSAGPQAVGHTLALNGYVCLTIDPWGSGERTTSHGIFEDHGDENGLGTSLMNIGETLMGIEISDNIRGVDLLCSLPYVDSRNIGATGASGGGNQTMWLASLDERIKAAMPVVSAGTFESHIMGSPCICEVLDNALSFTEEAGVLALVAPRAIKMCNHKKDDIPAFLPVEMLRSYNNARPVFKMYGVENNIAYEVFDLPHGYKAEDREALLGWFDLHLKGLGTGVAKKEIPFKRLPEEKLMVFSKGHRDSDIVSTVEYCIEKGNQLRNVFLSTGSFNQALKRKELKDLLGISEKSILNNAHEYSKLDGWFRFALETSDNKLIPLLVRSPSTLTHEFVIVANPRGKDSIPSDLIDEIIKSGKGIAIVDLSGTGEASSPSPEFSYNWGKLRAVSRSELWFGRTIIGEWIKELGVVTQFLGSNFSADKVNMDGSREAGLAGLFLAALEESIDNLVIREAPVSYKFDTRKGIDFFSMGIHLPGFLKWGDVSLVAALTGKDIIFINPVTMSGNALTKETLSDVESEFALMRTLNHTSGKTVFK